MGAPEPVSARRPLKSRARPLIRRFASWLAAHGVRPNAISMASVVFAGLAGAALALLPAAGGDAARAGLLLAAALCIQLRLAANLIDGLVAVEGGLGGKTGELFNDVPDRVADAAILVCAGYGAGAAFAPELGWAAAVLAVLTAYVRVLGGSLGLEQDFSGPMSKPQRMAVMTVACLVSAFAGHAGVVLAVALGLVALGSALTCVLRLRRMAAGLEAR